MSKKLDITDEAMLVLEANKSEGYSFKRLASEAIIEKYGKPKHSAGPVQTHDGPLRYPPSHYTGEHWEGNPIPSNADVKVAAKLLVKHKGIKEHALRELGNTDPNYKKIAVAILELAGEGV
ncbi:MAG: hypothetical protein FWF63_00380 [Fibromonadales bacterium]|nr:hypothetical protein [Fibromonadales bacterium]